ncbi:MAG: hypothetical protein LIO37_05095, partial [Clostridiales bacterium]|nr:hypothetical protein [Clostridiales bacterium]
MLKRIIKPVTIVLAFLVSLVIFSVLTNSTNTDLTASMSEATLPIISFKYGDTQIEQLHAYVTEMEVTGMRDSIIPLDSDRMLDMEIASYGMDINGVSYQVRSLDGTRLVADGESTDLEIDGQTVYVSFQIQNLLTVGEEYALVIILEADNQTLYYYSRIMSCGESDMQEYIDFVYEFHGYTFRDDAEEFIPTYMETTTGDRSTLQYVDLNCSLSQITWGDFEGDILGDPVMSVKEILDTYTVITLEYVMTSVNEAGETEYYNVEEYYRLRNTSDRMYVLNFERTMDQIFRGENTFLTDSNAIILGITDSDVNYKTNESGDMIAFVQEGELWSYDTSSNIISQVFSFRSSEGIDARENWDQHDIKIVHVDEAGSVDFIVYGYMNAGDHEGEVGLAIYHYDALARSVEEEAFLPSTLSYEIVKAQMGQLMFENEQGTIFLMLGGNVYSIDTSTLTVEELISGLEEGCYAISESNQYFAWVKSESLYSSETIYLLDLQSGETEKISEGDGIYLMPLGFFGEDFIYGAADAEMVAENSVGSMVFPMNYLKIMSMESGEILKEYSQDGVYIESISIGDASIAVNLVTESDGQYASAGSDAIMDREPESDDGVAVSSITSDDKLSQAVLLLVESVDESKVKMIVPKGVILEEDRTLTIENDSTENQYLVYVKGDVVLATGNIADAIEMANDNAGVVVDENQQYLWQRSRSTTKEAISVSSGASDISSGSVVKCLSAILNLNGLEIDVSSLLEEGYTAMEILQNNLTEYKVLDLTGCPVEGLLFYVSNGNPVFAMTGSQSAVLIVGYNSE